MDSKGGNPFLMDDYQAESDDRVTGQATSNPFLQDFGPTETTSTGENPFLNFAADQSYEPSIDVNSTNPFASFGMDTSSPGTGFDTTTITNTPATDIITSQATDMFATAEEEPTPNLFDTKVPAQATEEMFSQPIETAVSVTSPPQPKNGKTVPSRPPPPRPQPPAPPKNTKDLILSVTGAMDATSNHLLDRLQVGRFIWVNLASILRCTEYTWSLLVIFDFNLLRSLQATRTPSPTLMHSPSPTPEHSFADLLDVDSNVPDLLSDDSKMVDTPKNQDILDLLDAPNTDTTTTTIFSSSMTTGDTASLISGVPLAATTAQDNPFSTIEQETSTAQAEDGFVDICITW